MTYSTVSKASFVVSVAFLSLVYGYVARWHGWFPDTFFDQVQQQANAVVNPPFLATKAYNRSGVQVKAPEKMQDGLTLLSSLWKEGDEWHPGLRLIDARGKTVHHWPIDRAALFPDSLNLRRDPTEKILHGSYLLPNGDVLVNVDYVGTARIDACGDPVWRLPARNHHSIARDEDGSFWIPATSRTRRATTAQHPDGFPGLDDPVWQDQIVKVSESGDILDRLNVLDLLFSNDLQFYVSKAHMSVNVDGPHTNDLTHLNDVEPLKTSLADEYPLFDAGDLLISLRNLHLVLVFDPDTEVVKWHASDPLIMQHDPDFLGDGWIGVFNNNTDFSSRGQMLGGSEIVAFQPHSDSTVVRFPTPNSEPFYTRKMGKWQQLDNGNMLLTETRTGRVVEVGPSGNTVWEFVRRPYNNSTVPLVPKAVRHDLTRDEVASWPCSSSPAPRSSK